MWHRWTFSIDCGSSARNIACTEAARTPVATAILTLPLPCCLTMNNSPLTWSTILLLLLLLLLLLVCCLLLLQYRFLTIWAVYSVCTSVVVFKASRSPMDKATPRRVYALPQPLFVPLLPAQSVHAAYAHQPATEHQRSTNQDAHTCC
jgi:hypothetical protein